MPSQGRSEDERGSVIAPAVQSNLTVAAPLQRRCQAGGSVAQFSLSAGRFFSEWLAWSGQNPNSLPSHVTARSNTSGEGFAYRDSVMLSGAWPRKYWA
jgi:hypothetical protein